MTAAGVQLAARRGQSRKDRTRIGIGVLLDATAMGETCRRLATHGGGAGGEGAAAEAEEESRGLVLVEFGTDRNFSTTPPLGKSLAACLRGQDARSPVVNSIPWR
jgi:hypothetical protein